MCFKYPGLLLVFLLSAFISGASGAIYVENATAFDLSLNTEPAGLNSSLDGVQPRIFMEHVDSILGLNLNATSAELNSSLNTIRPRIFTEHLDAILKSNISKAPEVLNNSLDQIRPRIFTEHLDAILKKNLTDTQNTLNYSLAQIRPRIFIESADALWFKPLNGTSLTAVINDRSLLQVQGQPEVYWLQNSRLYWVTDWNVINQMSGLPGWGAVNTLSASVFNPADYPEGPRFITTGAESDGLLIREQGRPEVYLILGGEKHHFTSPEALTWNGYGFNDVIDVSAAVVGMFPEGTPISVQDKKLLRKPGGIDVFWSQKGNLYYVTADALNKMAGIYGWGWDKIIEPADFNPKDKSQYRTFISTGPESDGVLIRQWGDYKVYLVEDGFRRHVTYPDVMELYGYSMDDVIDVSQAIMDMFPSGGPIGIEVNLSFSKKTDSGEILYVTRFTTNETVRFYTETKVSESYTVDTYVKLTEPNGRTRYAYYTSSNFQPTDPLSFSDMEVRLYPDHWNAVTKTWNWHEYTFTNDEEGVYTWEFYYKDAASGKVLGWDKKSYVFVKKTELGIQLNLSNIKDKYGKNESIEIIAFVSDSNRNGVVANEFNVTVDLKSQNITNTSIDIPGKYKITGARAPGSSGNYQIDVSVKTATDNAHNFKNIIVEDYTTYKVLMILACPAGLCVNGQPNVDPWYNTHGAPQWYRDLEPELHDYYWKISYNKVNLSFTTTDWLNLDKRYGANISTVAIDEYNESIKKAEAAGYNIKENDIVVIIEPTQGGFKWQTASGGTYLGFYFRDGTIEKGFGIFIPTLYNEGEQADEKMINNIDHEITHAIDGIDDSERNEINGNGNGHGDDDDPGGPCIMCPNNKVEHQPFNPVNAWKMGFSSYNEIHVPSGFFKSPFETTLLPIEGRANRAVHFQPAFMRTYDLFWDTAISGYRLKEKITEYNYWIEFRDGSWGTERGVLIWRSQDQNPRDENNIPNWDQLKHVHPFLMSPGKLYYDWLTDFKLKLSSISNTAEIEIKYATDAFVDSKKTSSFDYDIKIWIVGKFFKNFQYNFSVIDIVDQTEVFNSTLTTNSKGEFDTPINFNDTITGNIENHPYLIKVQTIEGWVPFLVATPSIIDGISNEKPTFSINDPIETNTAGDLANLTSTSGSMKLSLKTAAPVNTDSYKYVVYLDSDNSTATGFAVNSIGADYKIEYTGAGARLYNYNTSWTVVDTPYLKSAHNGTNIEILTSTEIMNGSDEVKLVAQTIDIGGKVYDTLPDPASEQPYLQFYEVHAMEIRFARPEYYAGDNVTINGYGFGPNQIIPIAIKNQTDNVLWEGSVQADSNGLVINVSTWMVPDDFDGRAYLYWSGAQMDSFSRGIPPLPNYNANFELKTPRAVGVGREFNVTINFSNIGDDLTNLTLSLNTTGMTNDPETIQINNLTSGKNYTHTWRLTSNNSGFALLKAEMNSDQTTFTTGETGIYIANISVEFQLSTDIVNSGTFAFNVSAISHQKNITYTDLMVNTSIRNLETSFIRPLIALSPERFVNISYLWDTTNTTPGTYQIVAEVISNGVILTSNEKNIKVGQFGIDNIHYTAGPTWLNFTWTNPPDTDFSHVMLYLNGTFITNVSAPQNYYNVTGLVPDTLYELGTHTVDTAGNINETWINKTARTASSSAATYAITLKSGWNLISAPLNLANWSLDEEAIVGNPLNVTPTNSLSSLYRYNTTSFLFEKSDHFNDWGWWPATGSESFTKLEPGRGYWVMAQQDCSLTFTGTAPSDLNIPIDSGWNLIGWYSMNKVALGQESVVGNPLNVTPANSLTSIYRYNTTSALFEKSDHFPDWGWWPATGSEGFIALEPGRGYWVMAKNDAVWRHRN